MASNEWEGSRVRLRAIEPEDWKFFHEWNVDSDMARRSYETHIPTSAATVRAWAEKTALDVAGDERFLVIETLAGEIVGSINTVSVDRRNGTFRHGIAVREDFRRSGYASEAILLVLDYFFNEIGLQKSNALIYAFNDASVRLHQKLGYVSEGRQRRMVYTEGKHHDTLWYGLTAEEFRERHGEWREG